MVKLLLLNHQQIKMTTFRLKNFKWGFTLIEIMVAVSIFSIVALIVSGAFITLASIFKKTQTNRAVIDNINLTMDTMALQIREGKNYIFDEPCAVPGPGFTCFKKITFDEYVVENDEYQKRRTLSYEKNNNGEILQCEDGDCSALTSSEIKIENLNFYKKTGRPTMLVVVVDGVAIARDNLESRFTLQTSLSQRNYGDE